MWYNIAKLIFLLTLVTSLIETKQSGTFRNNEVKVLEGQHKLNEGKEGSSRLPQIYIEKKRLIPAEYFTNERYK
ncbi:hypothetical protein evm_002890 [Chilo suppressalis]|nr:hypothetical protein evm_002890 [Chilo suppressalis]